VVRPEFPVLVVRWVALPAAPAAALVLVMAAGCLDFPVQAVLAGPGLRWVLVGMDWYASANLLTPKVTNI